MCSTRLCSNPLNQFCNCDCTILLSVFKVIHNNSAKHSARARGTVDYIESKKQTAELFTDEESLRLQMYPPGMGSVSPVCKRWRLLWEIFASWSPLPLALAVEMENGEFALARLSLKYSARLIRPRVALGAVVYSFIVFWDDFVGLPSIYVLYIIWRVINKD